MTLSDNEWKGVVQGVTKNDDECQWMAASGTTNDYEWERVVQKVATSTTKSGNEWQRVTINDNG